MAWLKTDMHIHTCEDPKDKFITYSSKELIDRASGLGFKILAITPHEGYIFDREIEEYAADKGILLMPGVEARIESRDVLIINVSKKEYGYIKSFQDLRMLRKKNPNILVIAPHPFYFNTPLNSSCLHDKYFEHLDLFDAVEYNSFFNRYINPNRKAVNVARQTKKPVLGNSDLHFLSDFGRMFSEIDVAGKPTREKVVKAIREGKVRYAATPLSVIGTARMFMMHVLKREI